MCGGERALFDPVKPLLDDIGTRMPEADARLAADTLVQADLWGHQSHGVVRLSWYVARLKAGVCIPVAAPKS